MNKEDIKKFQEHAIGDVFEYEGRRIKVMPATDIDSCEGCIFKKPFCVDDETCLSGLRPDKKDVIFVEVPDGSDGSNGLNGPDGSEGHKATDDRHPLDAPASPSPTAPEQAQPIHPIHPTEPILVEKGILIPATLHRRLDYLGLLPNPVRNHNVGASDYADHFIQPWAIWLDYPDLTPWDADIIKRILRTKSTDPRITDYKKIIHICEERIRQIKFTENPQKHG